MPPPPPPPLPPGTVVPPPRLVSPPVSPPPAAQAPGLPSLAPVPPSPVPGSSVPVTPSPTPAAQGSSNIPLSPSLVPPVPKPSVRVPSLCPEVAFPTKVTYFEATDDVIGDRTQGQLRLRRGILVAIYKAEDKDWWLGKIGDEVGWIPASKIAPLDPAAVGRRGLASAKDAELPSVSLEWGSSGSGNQADVNMQAADIDMDYTEFSITTAKTFDHMGSKVTTFFIQVSGVKKGTGGAKGKGHGVIWVVAKTLKTFNRLRVAWEEDFGANTVPVEPPPARWADCTPEDWEAFRLSALHAFLEEVRRRPALKTSQGLKHFLTIDRVNLAGGIISSKAMKDFLDNWVKTSGEPTWTSTLPTMPSEPLGTISAQAVERSMPAKPAAPDKVVPGARPGDDGFGSLSSRRPKLRRSDAFAQITALAAVTRQEMLLEGDLQRGWMEPGLKLHLLTQGGQASSLKRRSEKCVYARYYETLAPGGARALTQRGSFQQMKFDTRLNLEKIMYGRVENLSNETNTKYAAYAASLRKQAAGSTTPGTSNPATPERGPGRAGKRASVTDDNRRSSSAATGSVTDSPARSDTGEGGEKGHVKKNTMFVLTALANRIDNIVKVNEIQTAYGSAKEVTLERCQYMSKVKGRFTMPMAAQLMALEELSQEKLEHWIAVKWPAMGAANTYHRLREIDSFLDKKRVRCGQLMRLMQEARATEEGLLMALTCCARLTDAVEAEDMGLWPAILPRLDTLNLERAKLCVAVLAAEAQAEEASRSSRKAAREVRADVQRARKALVFICKAVDKLRSGDIASDKFDQLKERLVMATDTAMEEYKDAVKDALPVNGFAAEAILWMERAEELYEELEELGTFVTDRVKAVHDEEDLGLQNDQPENTILQEAIEVALQIANNAYELSSRAAENARFDMQTALGEVAKAEKIKWRVTIEERRVYTECDAAEGRLPDENLPDDCPICVWSADMREMMEANLEKFSKDGQYRAHLESKGGKKGIEDCLMMGVLLAKVQLIRDIKDLRKAKKEHEAMVDKVKNAKSSRLSKKGKAAPRKSVHNNGGNGNTGLSPGTVSSNMSNASTPVRSTGDGSGATEGDKSTPDQGDRKASGIVIDQDLLAEDDDSAAGDVDIERDDVTSDSSDEHSGSSSSDSSADEGGGVPIKRGGSGAAGIAASRHSSGAPGMIVRRNDEMRKTLIQDAIGSSKKRRTPLQIAPTPGGVKVMFGGREDTPNSNVTSGSSTPAPRSVDSSPARSEKALASGAEGVSSSPLNAEQSVAHSDEETSFVTPPPSTGANAGETLVAPPIEEES